MKKHLVICDGCRVEAELIYNGAHYLPPKDWLDLYDDNKTIKTGQHLCPACVRGVLNQSREAKS